MENKICPKCNIAHEKDGNFCSRKCANSRHWSKESRLKLSKKILKINKEGKVKERRSYSPEEHMRRIALYDAKRKKRLSTTPFNLLSVWDKKKVILEEQKYKCNKCSLDTWLNQPITLELEHKDGNGQNNARDNLECLCPNCHSLTGTWKGRNVDRKRVVTDLQLIEAIKISDNYSQALQSCGLIGKGKNYRRIKKIKDKFNLKFKKEIYSGIV